LIFCFSLSSNWRYLFISRKHKVASVELSPLKAVKRRAQSTPASARPKSPPPLNRGEGKLHQEGEGQETGTPRLQEPEETVLAPGAIPPSGDADLGAWLGPCRPRRAGPSWHLARRLLKVPIGRILPDPRLPQQEEEATHRRARAPWSGPTLMTRREGPDLFWMIRRRLTSGRVSMHAVVPASRPSTGRLSS
jgi:hypothetical protein